MASQDRYKDSPALFPTTLAEKAGYQPYPRNLTVTRWPQGVSGPKQAALDGSILPHEYGSQEGTRVGRPRDGPLGWAVDRRSPSKT
jgi:hypothetical protein